MSFWDTADADVYTCHYCKLNHPKVEAAGIWYCPNLLCQGPGGGAFRSTLKSYREVSGDSQRHTVDHQEAVTVALAQAFEIEASDPKLAAHIRESAKQWTA